MDTATITKFIEDEFAGVVAVSAPNGDVFFYYDPEGNVPEKQRFPFTTLVNGDSYDAFSNLSRDGVFRLNIGVTKETFRALFPNASAPRDFKALDVIMPHPVYAAQYWVCVLNPSNETFEQKVKPLIAEAHAQVARRH